MPTKCPVYKGFRASPWRSTVYKALQAPLRQCAIQTVGGFCAMQIYPGISGQFLAAMARFAACACGRRRMSRPDRTIRSYRQSARAFDQQENWRRIIEAQVAGAIHLRLDVFDSPPGVGTPRGQGQRTVELFDERQKSALWPRWNWRCCRRISRNMRIAAGAADAARSATMATLMASRTKQASSTSSTEILTTKAPRYG